MILKFQWTFFQSSKIPQFLMLLKTYFNQMTEKEIILCQLLKALLQHPKILLIDELYLYFSHQEIMNIINFLKEYQQYVSFDI